METDLGWVDLMYSNEPLRHIYGRAPSTDRVNLCDLVLSVDRNCVKVRFDTRDLPDPMPQKWINKKANIVQIELEVSEITDFEVKGFPTSWMDGIGELRITGQGESRNLKFKNERITFDVTGDFLRLAGLSSYITTWLWWEDNPPRVLE